MVVLILILRLDEFKMNTATNTNNITDIIHNNDNIGITISIVCGDNNINVDFGMTNATNQS